MVAKTQATDAKARLMLPAAFANATVIVEQISDTELRIRRALAVPEDELMFVEELRQPLSDRDRDLFLELLENPPKPLPSLKNAATRFRKSQRE
jgi:hypothetical protein